MTYLAKVYVTLKKSILDPQGRTVERSLHQQGYAEVRDVRVGKYIELTLEGERAEVEARVREISENILSNPVMESVRFEIEALQPA
ncbi:phosphoribosylformylglycinamidine synthase [Deinobacterium chartae]|uniref:Phosphoribosylformylglycinamidine synthase subunit PurS n=1 Tax=Deinobacterium chartae TaxID=521158 RepID=A0A841I042_9DEIO|nr:phosphoribosylformylglycinamidine synthase subunit PurS [Deinobacterium chartae]MBB6097355.1 phosphoribosylformylglycinamidine synthase [Deinobacterium chartae]